MCVCGRPPVRQCVCEWIHEHGAACVGRLIYCVLATKSQQVPATTPRLTASRAPTPRPTLRGLSTRCHQAPQPAVYSLGAAAILHVAGMENPAALGRPEGCAACRRTCRSSLRAATRWLLLRTAASSRGATTIHVVAAMHGLCAAATRHQYLTVGSSVAPARLEQSV